MPKKNIKKLVYEYITTPSYYPSKIAKILGVSRQYVNKIIKELESAGYIVCTNRDGRPKFYEKTKKPFSLYVNQKSTPLLHMKEDRLRGGCETVQVQGSQILFNVVTDVSQGGEKWDKVYRLRNGVEVFQYTHPFENFGDVVFRRFRGKRRDVVVVSLPRLLLPKDEVRDDGRVQQFLVDLAMRVVPLFQRRFHLRLGLPELVSKPDFAVPVREPGVADLARRFTFSVGEVRVDASPPDCVPEFESKNPVHVVNYIEAVQRIDELENALRNVFMVLKEVRDKYVGVVRQVEEVVEVGKKLSGQLSMVERLSGELKAIGELRGKLDRLRSDIERLSRLFEHSKKPDEFRDVV